MASDLFWSANNLSEDKMADPPMLGSLLLEGIWSCFFLSGWRVGGWGSFQRGGGGGSQTVSGLFLFLQPVSQSEVKVGVSAGGPSKCFLITNAYIID